MTSAPTRLLTLPPVLPNLTSPMRRRWLVLHGWAQSAAFWSPLARRLAGAGVALLCPDLRAAARECSAPAGSLDRTRELVTRLSDAGTRHDVSAIVAHSAGATVGVLLAAELPIGALALIDPLAHQLGVADPPTPREALIPPEAPTLPATGAPTEELLHQLYPFAEGQTLRTIATALGQSSRLEGRVGRLTVSPERAAAARSALAELRIPLVLLRGDRSALLSDEHVRRILAATPRATAHVVTAAGHSAHVDRPRAVAEILLAEVPTR